MPQIEITKAEPGMVLAADVVGPGNQVLVTAGSELSGRHIELLRTRDVTEVEVETDESASPDTNTDIDPKLLEMMALRFGENGDHPFIDELKKIWLKKAAKKQ